MMQDAVVSLIAGSEAESLIAEWESKGCPHLYLGSDGTITDLSKWLYQGPPITALADRILGQVRVILANHATAAAPQENEDDEQHQETHVVEPEPETVVSEETPAVVDEPATDHEPDEQQPDTPEPEPVVAQETPAVVDEPATREEPDEQQPDTPVAAPEPEPEAVDDTANAEQNDETEDEPDPAEEDSAPQMAMML